MTKVPEVRLFSCVLKDIQPSADWRQQLSADEIQRAENLDELQCARFLTSRLFVRNSIASLLQCAPAAVEFDWPMRGKPALKDPDWHFNISHTKDRLVLAVGRHPVGVDLESSGRHNRLMDIANRYFSPEEVVWLKQQPEELEQRFLRLWTLKESLSKLLGCGIGPKVLREISCIEGTNPSPRMSFTGPVCQSFYQMQAPEGQCLLSLCVGTAQAEEIDLISSDNWVPLN